jgi:replication-associated recombination protein RarA
VNPVTYTPSIPADFIGSARKVAEYLVKALAASRSAECECLKFLFNGPPGVGKSELVKFLQKQAGIHPLWSTHKLNGTEVTMGAIDDMKRAMAYRDLYGDYKLFWIDEADKIPNTAQVRFLTLLDDLPAGVIVACTSNCKLAEFENRFQTRFTVQELEAVEDAEIAALVTRFIPNPPQHAAGIAKAAKGNVRQALLDTKGLMVALG